MDPRLVELRDHVGYTVSRETFGRLLEFEEIFRAWSERINLASRTTLETFWERHILDSAQLMRHAPGPASWIDLGSGGGLPGVVVAILLMEKPGSKIDLVESNAKKAAFLTSALAKAGASPSVHRMRIESAWPATGRRDIVTARALAPLPRLLDLAGPWLETGATALFHKGREYRAEIDESRVVWDFDLLEHQSLVEPDSRILEISRLRRKQDQAIKTQALAQHDK